jgi:NAD(P)H-flavin reductase
MSATETLTTPTPSAADPMLPDLFRIRRVRPETNDTFTLELGPVQSGKKFSFLPGQFNMMYVFGVGEVPISISGDPTSPGLLVHTVRAVGSVTKAMWKMKSGDIIGIRGPFGSAWPVQEMEGNDVVIVAGGIGLAPLRPALYYVLANRSKFGKVVLLYGTRTPDDILYRKELESLRARFDLEIDVTVDRAAGDWHGNVGVVTRLIPKASFDPQNTVALLCGPEVMMRFTVMALQKRDLPIENIYLTMERNMKCAIGLCGHCQMGPLFVCKDGPVFRYDRIRDIFTTREI